MHTFLPHTEPGLGNLWVILAAANEKRKHLWHHHHFHCKVTLWSDSPLHTQAGSWPLTENPRLQEGLPFLLILWLDCPQDVGPHPWKWQGSLLTTGFQERANSVMWRPACRVRVEVAATFPWLSFLHVLLASEYFVITKILLHVSCLGLERILNIFLHTQVESGFLSPVLSVCFLRWAQLLPARAREGEGSLWSVRSSFKSGPETV